MPSVLHESCLSILRIELWREDSANQAKDRTYVFSLLNSNKCKPNKQFRRMVFIIFYLQKRVNSRYIEHKISPKELLYVRIKITSLGIKYSSNR